MEQRPPLRRTVRSHRRAPVWWNFSHNQRARDKFGASSCAVAAHRRGTWPTDRTFKRPIWRARLAPTRRPNQRGDRSRLVQIAARPRRSLWRRGETLIRARPCARLRGLEGERPLPSGGRGRKWDVGQAEVAEDHLDDGRLLDHRDHPHPAPASGTREDVDLEDPPQEARPVDARGPVSPGVLRGLRLRRSRLLPERDSPRPSRYDLRLRCFAFGASTPWKRTRCTRGGGTSTASFFV